MNMLRGRAPSSSRTSPAWVSTRRPCASSRAICAGVSLGNICSRRFSRILFTMTRPCARDEDSLLSTVGKGKSIPSLGRAVGHVALAALDEIAERLVLGRIKHRRLIALEQRLAYDLPRPRTREASGSVSLMVKIHLYYMVLEEDPRMVDIGVRGEVNLVHHT